MRPVILTEERADGGRRDIYVSPEAIAYFKATSRDDNGTYVYFIGGAGTLHVEESPEIILRRLEDNRVSLRAEDRDGLRALA